MQTTIYTANDRGTADHGWLQAKFSFSFANYYNPEKIHFGKLRVLNDDIIAGGSGFNAHPHENMEIISIPISGALKHKDSTGSNGVIRPNEVQVMSAGSGIEHSEVNFLKNDFTNILQLWIFPEVQNTTPNYQQQYFDPHTRTNTWQPVVSPLHMGALDIKQKAVISLSNIEAGKSINYVMNYEGNGVYLYIVQGEITFNKNLIAEKGAVAIRDTDTFTLTAEKSSYLLAIEVPLN